MTTRMIKKTHAVEIQRETVEVVFVESVRIKEIVNSCEQLKHLFNC